MMHGYYQTTDGWVGKALAEMSPEELDEMHYGKDNVYAKCAREIHESDCMMPKIVSILKKHFKEME